MDAHVSEAPRCLEVVVCSWSKWAFSGGDVSRKARRQQGQSRVRLLLRQAVATGHAQGFLYFGD